MKITLTTQSGVPKSEIGAHQKIQKAFAESKFSKEWFGYASFKMARARRGEGDDDFDLVLVTHNSVVVIELKNWHGRRLISDGHTWRLDDESPRASPVQLANLKAKKLGTLMKEKLGSTKTPFVHSFVVLHGRVNELSLTEDEKRSVLTLEELLSWKSAQEYDKFVTKKSGVNPLAHRGAYDLFFTGQAFKRRTYLVQGYLPDDKPMWTHPGKLYAEFRATEKSDRDKLALMRQWDFGALGMDLIGENERGFIGLREQHIYEYVELRNEELSRSLLRPVSRKSESDMTMDFSELFVLPPKVARLSEFVNAVLPKMNGEERVLLAKTLLQRFAELHELNVAHRDIGAHCLWVDRPAKVVMSGFPAAYYPSMKTVGTFRNRVKVERALLPEDRGSMEEATPFRRDVYMLGVLSHLILFGERPPSVNGVYTWVPRNDEVFGSRFHDILQKAMAQESRDRFESARAMLEAVNAVTARGSEQLIDLKAFDAYRSATRAKDYDEEELLYEDDDVAVGRASFADGEVLLKEWTGIVPDPARPDFSIRLLGFLERARNLRGYAIAGLPKILDFGLSRKNLLLVQEWVPGMTLPQWCAAGATLEERLCVAARLADTLQRLHEFELAHGDIKPDNIVVTPEGEPFLIDILDFRSKGDDVYSTAYLPADYKSLSPQQRDLYAFAFVMKEVLVDPSLPPHASVSTSVMAEFDRLLQDRRVLSLDPLHKVLSGGEGVGIARDLLTIKLTIGRNSTAVAEEGELLSDNGFFYLSSESSRKYPGSTLYRLVGVDTLLVIDWDHTNDNLNSLFAERLELGRFIAARSRASCMLEARIFVQRGPRHDAEALVAAMSGLVESNSAPLEPVSSTENDEDVQDASSSHADGTEIRNIAPVVRPTLDIRELWRSLLDAEEESLPAVVVTGPPYRDEAFSSRLYIPCTLEGTGFDPESDDDAWVEWCGSDGAWKRGGYLELEDSDFRDPALLAVDGWKGRSPEIGTRLRLRTNMENASFQRRRQAVDRILEGKSVIPNLIDYFQPEGTAAPSTFKSPSDADLEQYSQGTKQLNESQREAFKKALGYGPVSLLQGPPGTGKTWFIASLMHFLVTAEGARRVLVVSQAHEAVNNALEKAQELFSGKGLPFDAVRLGHESVVSDSIRHLHSSAIEQAYREKFKAEFKERVMGIGMELGLPKLFVNDAVDIHLQLGRLAQELTRLERSVSDANPNSDDDGESQHHEQRIRRLRDTFAETCQRVYQVQSESHPLQVVDTLLRELVHRHDVQSPQAVEKLSRLMLLSDEWLRALGEPAANFVEFLAKSRTFVAGTLVGIGRRAAGVIQNLYDWVIIDEAGRAAPSELAVAMQTGRRILLVGDHKQLPPTFTDEVANIVTRDFPGQPEETLLGSDFQRMFESSYGRVVGTALRVQYRMAPTIGAVVADTFYREERLETGRQPAPDAYSCLPAYLHKELTWVDMSPLGKAGFEDKKQDRKDIRNEAEADIVVNILRSIVESDAAMKVLLADLRDGEQPIGIITMYGRQRRVLANKLAGATWLPKTLRKYIKVDTVDSYQGKENRIIILSTVRNNPGREVGFLRSTNRINVAMSRAMERLIIVGATSMWRDRNGHLPLGRALSKVEEMISAGNASLVSAKELTK